MGEASSTLGLEARGELSGYEVPLVFGRVLRQPWQPMRYPGRPSIREIAAIVFDGRSTGWEMQEFREFLAADAAARGQTRELEPDDVIYEFSICATWTLVQDRKARPVRIHDWFQDHIGPKLFAREARLWYRAIASEYRLWLQYEFEDLQTAANQELRQERTEINVSEDANLEEREEFFREMGFDGNEDPDWPENDPRWDRLRVIEDRYGEISGQQLAIMKRIEGRERALDRQFVKFSERERPSPSLVHDWVRWRGYDLSERDVLKRLLPRLDR